MVTRMNSELEWLRGEYLEDLGKTVNYGGSIRPRVRHIEKWRNIETKLAEGVEEQLDLATYTRQQIWVWSDLHFGHKNIIEFSERPYSNVDEMNEHLVANYNDYVQPDDIGIWVGDVSFMKDETTNELLDRCNGYKILIIGNHDFNRKKLRNLNFDEQHLILNVDIDEVSLVFTHYPMQNLIEPWFNIHGHLHGGPHAGKAAKRQMDLQHINVNCEFHEYKPINFSKIVDMCKQRRPSMKI